MLKETVQRGHLTITRRLDEALPKGMGYTAGLPTEKGLGMDAEFALGELPSHLKTLIKAVKEGNNKQAKKSMGFVLGNLAFIARVTGDLEHLRAPLSKMAAPLHGRFGL